MGSVVGKVSFDPCAPIPVAPLEQMLDESAGSHAGTRHLYSAPGVALGSIRSSTACAPLSADFEIAADAQLTNGAALRAELEALGDDCHSAADTELILQVFARWGIPGFARLRGAFACAIWDRRERRLVLTRDHIGLRPLYFTVLPGEGVVFATMLRALLRDPAVRREWSPSAIDAYLTLGYVPSPLTAFRRISKLEPAHALVVEGRGLHVEQYWDLPAPAPADERDALATIGARLRQSVAAQPVGERRNGLLYSGGTASTTLLSMTLPAAWPTVLTVPLDRAASDITRSARAAGLLGRTCQTHSGRPDFPVLARELAAVADEPVADPWAVSQFAIAHASRHYVDCALTGTGTATLWADQARHRVERLETALRARLTRPLAQFGAEIARSLPDGVKGAHAIARLALGAADACAVKHAYGLWDDPWRRTLYTRDFAWQVRDHNPLTRHVELYVARGTADSMDRALYVDARTFLPDSVLATSHAIARASGLQLRFPMLDVDVVNCAAQTPSIYKQRGLAGMYALHRLLARELPAALMPPARRVPARHAWLTPALRALVPAVLLGPRFDERGIVSRPVLRQLWDEHRRGRGRHAHRLWSLLMLEFWFRNAIDGNAADVPSEYAVLTAA